MKKSDLVKAVAGMMTMYAVTKLSSACGKFVLAVEVADRMDEQKAGHFVIDTMKHDYSPEFIIAAHAMLTTLWGISGRDDF